MNEEQAYLFEELLREARMEYPDSLDYNLQILCYKLAVEGTLDADVNEEDIVKMKEKYSDNTNIYYTD